MLVPDVTKQGVFILLRDLWLATCSLIGLAQHVVSTGYRPLASHFTRDVVQKIYINWTRPLSIHAAEAT